MCGIIGLWRFKESLIQEDRQWLSHSLSRMSYRGPDESRVVEDESLLLGFNRLAIRDLTPTGSQPMYSASRNSVIVYNGEVYNIERLIKNAGIDIKTLRGTSDTEVLLEIAEKHGVQWLLERVDGIFSFAFYNKTLGQLFLARDHLGVKPLYIGWTNNFICFSSEYNAIVSHPQLANCSINIGALQNYLRFGFVQEGEGLLNQTMFFPQKHVMIVQNNGRQTIKPYDGDSFHLPILKTPLEDVIKDSVQSQLVSDVPLGAFLSGGIDSTLVAAMAKTEGVSLKTFTIAVDDSNMDESPAAAQIANKLGIDHDIGHVNRSISLRLLNDYKRSMGEALGDFSSLVTLEASRLAKSKITVVLSGDGGDELFWGYKRFQRVPEAYLFFSKKRLGRICHWLFRRLSQNDIPFEWLKYKDFGNYYLKVQGQIGADIWGPKLINKPWYPALPPILQGLNLNPSQLEDATKLARTIEKRIHLQRVLLKVDRASMFHSLEVRTPLLSRRIEMASETLSFYECLDNVGNGKKPLRTLALKYLNMVEISEAPKRGFTFPLDQWLRNDLKTEVEARLTDIPLSLKPYFNTRNIKQMWEQHLSGIDNSWMIWNLYSLFEWTSRYLKKT